MTAPTNLRIGANLVSFESLWTTTSAVWNTITQLALAALQMLWEGLKALYNTCCPPDATIIQAVPAAASPGSSESADDCLPPPPEGMSLVDYYKCLAVTLWDISQNRAEQPVFSPEVARNQLTRIQEDPSAQVLAGATVEDQLRGFEAYVRCQHESVAALWSNDQGAFLLFTNNREWVQICGSRMVCQVVTEGRDGILNVLNGENRPADQPNPWEFQIFTVRPPNAT